MWKSLLLLAIWHGPGVQASDGSEAAGLLHSALQPFQTQRHALHSRWSNVVLQKASPSSDGTRREPAEAGNSMTMPVLLRVGAGGSETLRCGLPAGGSEATARAARSKARKQEAAAARWAPIRHRCLTWHMFDNVPPMRSHQQQQRPPPAAAEAASEAAPSDASLDTPASSELPSFGAGSAGQPEGEKRATAGEGGQLAPQELPVDASEPSVATEGGVESARTEGTTEAAHSKGPAWTYRFCFGLEFTRFAEGEWYDKQILGWRDEKLEQPHENGSVTVYYVNGTNGRRSSLHCDCTEGGPQVTGWSTSDAGRNFSLVVGMASCCALRDVKGARLPLHESFQWLTKAVRQANCYTLRQGSWRYHYCPSTETVSKSRIMVVGSESGEAASGSAEEAGFAPAGGDEGGSMAQSRDILGAGVKRVRVVPARLGARASQLLGGEKSSGDAVEEVPEDFQADDEEALTGALTLTFHLTPRGVGGGVHRAMEVELNERGTCDRSSSSSSSTAAAHSTNHKVLVRWVCPWTWKNSPPERMGGHTSLVLVERPSPCTLVLWMVSLWLCSDDRLRPLPAEATRMTCNQTSSGRSTKPAAEEAAVASAGSAAVADAAGKQEPWRREPRKEFLETQEPKADRSAIDVWVGQLVVNTADGTTSVVIGWDSDQRQFPGSMFAQQGIAEPSEGGNAKPAGVMDGAAQPHVFALACHGQVPVHGLLQAGVLGLPGRVSYVPQSMLRPLRVGSYENLRLKLPAAAIGVLFSGYDAEHGRFLPVPRLEALYPLDAGAVAAANAQRSARSGPAGEPSNAPSAEATSEPAPDVELTAAADAAPEAGRAADDATSSVLTQLIDRLQKARPNAVAQYASTHQQLMTAKQKQLREKIRDVERLQEKLTSLAENYKAATTDPLQELKTVTEMVTGTVGAEAEASATDTAAPADAEVHPEL
eukprot:TRINITY_DN28638_c0_g1_i1.p1 TRINITY_DN28638_c0_g1~~TRINITY_DN28638_c0_g1_i1.p1  ORF type:complete len:937 (+),score=191.07 TRINITY_DN28638_c0_g1_i1:40-2850(+)